MYIQGLSPARAEYGRGGIRSEGGAPVSFGLVSGPIDPPAAKFSLGELIRHQRFDYRGVIVDVDATFQGTEEWYEGVARSRPPKDRPWYHVLVHDAQHMTYVAERNLEPDPSSERIRHPLLPHFFDAFEDGRYGRSGSLN